MLRVDIGGSDMKKTALYLLAVAALGAGAAFAQTAVVEAVQYPAWLERGGAAGPPAPGPTLPPPGRPPPRGNPRGQLQKAAGTAGEVRREAQLSSDHSAR